MMGPFSKIQAGWVTPIDVLADGIFAVQPAEISHQIYKISAGFPEGEYLLIENRYKMKWESDWPAQGIVIWHVDEMMPLQQFLNYPGSTGDFTWPAFHYRVSVLQADGNYDIEKGVNLGDEGDFWAKDQVLGPGPDTWPNTDSIQGAHYQTGVSIAIQSDPSFIIQIQITGPNPCAGGC
jgi:hypothetical protein